jgi:hypothetical protein
MLSVIGVHSSAVGGSSATGNKFADGHAWLTLHYTNGRSTSIGLWAEHELFSWNHLVRDPIGLTSRSAEQFEARFGEEIKRNYRPAVSRFYGLYQGQSAKAVMCLGQYSGWRAGHTCATWATEKIQQIFGVKLASQELWGLTNTPRALGAALQRLNLAGPTTVSRPKYVR